MKYKKEYHAKVEILHENGRNRLQIESDISFALLLFLIL